MRKKYPIVIRNAGSIEGRPFFKKRRGCQVCKVPAKKVVEVQHGIFRGDDSVVVLCEGHRDVLSDQEIIKLTWGNDEG